MSSPNSPLKITIAPDGPYLVAGGVPLTERCSAESINIANAVLVLALPDAQWIHGQVIQANGGIL